MEPLEPVEMIAKNRSYIAKTFGNRFDTAVKEYDGVHQGQLVRVDLSKCVTGAGHRTRKYRGVDQLLVVSIARDCKTFIGMTGSLDIVSAPFNVILK